MIIGSNVIQKKVHHESISSNNRETQDQIVLSEPFSPSEKLKIHLLGFNSNGSYSVSEKEIDMSNLMEDERYKQDKEIVLKYIIV